MHPEVLKRELILISLHVNQCLIQIKYQQLVEASLCKLKFYFILRTDHRELFYLLYHVDSLEDLHRHVFVDRELQRAIRKVLILLEDFLRVQWCRVRRALLRGCILLSRAARIHQSASVFLAV